MVSLLLACTLSLLSEHLLQKLFSLLHLREKMAVRSSVPPQFFPFEFLNMKFSLYARSPAVTENQAAVLLPSPTNHIIAAATPVLARFSLRARCCSVIVSGVPGIADSARGEEAGLFELPSTLASVACRARPPHTEGSEARLLEKLVPYAKRNADGPPPPPPLADSVTLDSDANADADAPPSVASVGVEVRRPRLRRRCRRPFASLS